MNTATGTTHPPTGCLISEKVLEEALAESLATQGPETPKKPQTTRPTYKHPKKAVPKDPVGLGIV